MIQPLNNSTDFARSEVFMVVKIQVKVFWIVTSYSVVGYQH